MVLMQLEAAELSGQQKIESQDLAVLGDPILRRLEAGDAVGQRIWLQAETQFDCMYQTRLRISRSCTDLDTIPAVPLQDLPSDVVKYLLPSRYCLINEIDCESNLELGDRRGGRLIAAMSNWIGENFTYDIGASDSSTTSTRSFERRRGVCRDYAHVLISMARTSGIPARYASVYSPDVDPMDFHAVAEVYLGGAWHMVDPTGMSVPERTAIIGVGRDAADVAFLTSFGELQFVSQLVSVEVADSES